MGHARNTEVNRSLMQIPRRAESADQQDLATTFVVVGSLSAMLESADHQILYGRRGGWRVPARRAERALQQVDDLGVEGPPVRSGLLDEACVQVRWQAERDPLLIVHARMMP